MLRLLLVPWGTTASQPSLLGASACTVMATAAASAGTPCRPASATVSRCPAASGVPGATARNCVSGTKLPGSWSAFARACARGSDDADADVVPAGCARCPAGAAAATPGTLAATTATSAGTASRTRRTGPLSGGEGTDPSSLRRTADRSRAGEVTIRRRGCPETDERQRARRFGEGLGQGERAVRPLRSRS